MSGCKPTNEIIHEMYSASHLDEAISINEASPILYSCKPLFNIYLYCDNTAILLKLGCTLLQHPLQCPVKYPYNILAVAQPPILCLLCYSMASVRIEYMYSSQFVVSCLGMRHTTYLRTCRTQSSLVLRLA